MKFRIKVKLITNWPVNENEKFKNKKIKQNNIVRGIKSLFANLNWIMLLNFSCSNIKYSNFELVHKHFCFCFCWFFVEDFFVHEMKC